MGALFGIAVMLVVVGTAVRVASSEGFGWAMATAGFLIVVALGAAELASLVP